MPNTQHHEASPKGNTSLKILTFGAGAIGTYIGGSLALQGHKVTFLERPQVAQDIRSHGMRLELKGERHTISNPSVAGSLVEALKLGPFDVGIFALKSYHTEMMLKDLLPYKDKIPPLLCLQNGVENETTLGQALGPDNVIPGTVTSAIGRLDAGDIRLEKNRGIGVSSGHPLSQRLVTACNEANLNAELFFQPMAMKWSKMLTNLLANASSAILDMPPAEVFAHPGLYRLEVQQIREALAVMRAQNLRPVNLPGTPVKLLAWVLRFLPVKLSQPLIKKAVGGGRGGKMPSFHIDLHSGRGRSEVDYLNGAVVRFGKRFGIPTPVNRLLNETLQGLTRGEIPLETYARQPEKLLREW